ncbi:MAG: hypothetical protein Q9214_002402 [Letrouitia sp. 1 TL-2023]
MEEVSAPPHSVILSQLQNLPSPPRDIIASQAQDVVAPVSGASVLQDQNLVEASQSVIKRSSQEQTSAAGADTPAQENLPSLSGDIAAEELDRNGSSSQDSTLQHSVGSAKVSQFEMYQQKRSSVGSIKDDTLEQKSEISKQSTDHQLKGKGTSTMSIVISATVKEASSVAVAPLELRAWLYQKLRRRDDRPSQKVEAANLIISGAKSQSQANEPAGVTENLWKSAMELYINQLSAKDRRFVHNPQNLCSLNV